VRLVARAVITALIAIIAASCGSPKIDDLLGLWILSTGGAAPKATLRLDRSGKFELTAAPSSIVGAENTVPINIDGKGEWKLISRDGEYAVLLSFSSIQPDIGVKTPFGSPLGMSKYPRPSLYYFVGDPDAGQRVQFERQ